MWNLGNLLEQVAKKVKEIALRKREHEKGYFQKVSNLDKIKIGSLLHHIWSTTK